MSMPSKYAAAHADPKGPGDSRPTAQDIIRDEGLTNKLSDKTFLITGCSSGIGIETARALATTGARIFCTVRDLAKGQTALSDILEGPKSRTTLLKLDLSSLESVRSCAAEFLEKSNDRLNVLICNAGIMGNPTLDRTADGFEAQFGTNHLAHFLLFNLLKPALLASSTASFHSRVVTLASSGHRGSGIHHEDYNLEKPGAYAPYVGYGQSKTANIYMANEIERRFSGHRLHALSVHPGGIWSGLQIHMSDASIANYKTNEHVNNSMKSSAQGAATTVWAAVAKEWEGKGGRYCEDCRVSEPLKEGASALDGGHASHAYDEEGERRLWTDSLKMVGVQA